MVLDLNLLSVDESSLTVPGKLLPEGSGGRQMEDSGSSNSPVLNAEGSSVAAEENSSARPAVRFDVLKNTAEGEKLEVEVNGGNSGVGSGIFYVTRQLFPPPSVEGIPPPPAQSSPRQHFIDLSFRHADSPAISEVNLLHPQQLKKNRRGPRSRSSQYRGVTFYRRTGRWESHIWDSGKQVYLGGFDTAHAAARAYDRSAIKFRGVGADINFNLNDYEEDMIQMKNLSKEEFVHILRRQSTGFSRGSSRYRGVTLHKCGRWEARMGQFLGKKAYDKAAIKCNGREAVTNFESCVYEGELLPQADDEAACHDIDLNLSISQPSIGNSKKTDISMGIQFLDNSVEAFNINKIKNDLSSSRAIVQPHYSAMASEHPQVRTHAFPGFFTTNEARAMSKKALITGLPAPPGWAWQIRCPSTPQLSCAASSGFYMASVAAAPSQPPSTTASYHPPASSTGQLPQ